MRTRRRGPSALWSSLPKLRKKLQREEVRHRKSADRTFTVHLFPRHINKTALPTTYPLDVDFDHHRLPSRPSFAYPLQQRCHPPKVRDALVLLRVEAWQRPSPAFCKGMKSSMKRRRIAFHCRLEVKDGLVVTGKTVGPCHPLPGKGCLSPLQGRQDDETGVSIAPGPPPAQMSRPKA